MSEVDPTLPILLSSTCILSLMHEDLPVLSHKQAIDDPDSFAEQLKNALLTTGFFYLADIQIPGWEQTVSDAFETSRQFFDDISESQKQEIGMIHSRHFRGYSAFGVEVTAGKHDLREQIDFGPESDALVAYPPDESSTTNLELSLYGPNQWPRALPDFRPRILAYRKACRELAYLILRTIATILTPDPTRLTEPFEILDERFPDYSRSKVVRYPPVTHFEHGALGVGAHKDGGAITVLCADKAGLQVQRWDGTWIDCMPPPFSAVINIGQTIERLSGGTFAATTHRVLPNIGNAPRISLPFFLSPRLDATLDPLTESELFPQLRDVARKRVEVSEVKKGDLHNHRFGLMAWRGISRSHGDVWKKYYARYDRVGGGPET